MKSRTTTPSAYIEKYSVMIIIFILYGHDFFNGPKMTTEGSNKLGFGMLSYKLGVVLVHVASLPKLQVECNHG